MRYNKPIIWPFYFLYKIFNYVCYCFRVKSLVIGRNERVNSKEHLDHFDLLQAYGLLNSMCVCVCVWGGGGGEEIGCFRIPLTECQNYKSPCNIKFSIQKEFLKNFN